MADGTTSAGLRVRLRQDAPVPLDLEFHCAPGELLALLGPSGAGKSTALRCVAGLARPAGSAAGGWPFAAATFSRALMCGYRA